MIIKLKKRYIDVKVKKLSVIGMATGLMFRTRNTKILLFNFRFKSREMNAITSHFVFFDFLAVWLDGKNNVLEIKKIKPFTTRIMCKHNAKKLIEIPFNDENKEILEFFVGKGKI